MNRSLYFIQYYLFKQILIYDASTEVVFPQSFCEYVAFFHGTSLKSQGHFWVTELFIGWTQIGGFFVFLLKCIPKTPVCRVLLDLQWENVPNHVPLTKKIVTIYHHNILKLWQALSQNSVSPCPRYSVPEFSQFLSHMVLKPKSSENILNLENANN